MPFARVRIFLTGGSGVLGRAARPMLAERGHDVVAPRHEELDLFSAEQVRAALAGADAVLHLATRIPPRERASDHGAWTENDRLRRDASRILVDAALATDVATYVQPSVTFVYPPGAPADEETPVADVSALLQSALAAENQALRFASHGRRGVVLRLGLLDGPGTANERPDPRFGATLHVDDAGAALAAALGVPSGIYNVTRDRERVSNDRFKAASGWRPRR